MKSWFLWDFYMACQARGQIGLAANWGEKAPSTANCAPPIELRNLVIRLQPVDTNRLHVGQLKGYTQFK
jgi:hypothetical protein